MQLLHTRIISHGYLCGENSSGITQEDTMPSLTMVTGPHNEALKLPPPI